MNKLFLTGYGLFLMEDYQTIECIILKYENFPSNNVLAFSKKTPISDSLNLENELRSLMPSICENFSGIKLEDSKSKTAELIFNLMETFNVFK